MQSRFSSKSTQRQKFYGKMSISLTSKYRKVFQWQGFYKKYTFDRTKTFSFHSLSSCVQPDLCDDNRNKLSLNPFGAFAAESFAASEDVLNGLISSAQNAKCPDEGDVCCSKEFTKEVSVDCIISPWSSCSQSCGPGTQNRTILVPAKNGGEECTGNLDRACNERNCPGKSTTIPYRVSTGPEQGFPCVVFPHKEKTCFQ